MKEKLTVILKEIFYAVKLMVEFDPILVSYYIMKNQKKKGEKSV
jgi:hypothetical protein